MKKHKPQNQSIPVIFKRGVDVYDKYSRDISALHQIWGDLEKFISENYIPLKYHKNFTNSLKRKIRDLQSDSSSAQDDLYCLGFSFCKDEIIEIINKKEIKK